MVAIKKNTVIGLHNWIGLYLEENKGNIDYSGYIKPHNKGKLNIDSDDQALFKCLSPTNNPFYRLDLVGIHTYYSKVSLFILNTIVLRLSMGGNTICRKQVT